MSVKLDWKQKSNYHMEAKHEGKVYTVSKVFQAGVPLFFAWGPSVGVPENRTHDWEKYVIRPIGGPYKSAKAAMNCCLRQLDKCKKV